ncbi:MAG: GpE family phage tail protein [Endozoicomonas sp. (ex Botrylloides leachii)]|nr:GpE family phage tail protein [Endozoicomonas sp. (ex Botrylloides leachii)]
MANIAVVFHWGPSEMKAMTVKELTLWHQKAVKRTGVSREKPSLRVRK